MDATVSAALAVIADDLEQGDDVKLNGFGALEIVDRPARSRRNPQTGAAIEIAATRSVKLKPAKALRESPRPGWGRA